MKYVIYARKSTESEDRQSLSIQSQIIEMQEVARRENLPIVKIFQESKSAKAPGRPIFADMIGYIESGKAEGILCWKIDRLARNPVDEGLLKWKLQNEEIKHIRTFDRDYFPSDNVVIASIEFSMANQYIRDLSRNVKRGLNEKVRLGEYPGARPIGYMTEPKTKKMVPDPEFAPFIRRAFQLYATTDIATDKLADHLYKEGFRSRAGNKVGKSTIHRILTNPVYAGMFHWKGRRYSGVHEALVPPSIFETTSGRLNKKRWSCAETKRPFPFRGVLVCGECGLKVTAEIQKGHTYYHCTKSKGVHRCSQPYVREEDLRERLGGALLDLAFDDETKKLIVDATRFNLQKRKVVESETETRLRRDLTELRKRKDSLVEKYIADSIPRDIYDEKYSRYVTEEAALAEQIENVCRTDTRLADQIEKIVAHLQSVHRTFSDAIPTDQKRHLSLLSSNIGIKDRNVAYINLNDPFSWVMEDVASLQALKATFEPTVLSGTKAKAASCDAAQSAKLGR